LSAPRGESNAQGSPAGPEPPHTPDKGAVPAAAPRPPPAKDGEAARRTPCQDSQTCPHQGKCDVEAGSAQSRAGYSPQGSVVGTCCNASGSTPRASRSRRNSAGFPATPTGAPSASYTRYATPGSSTTWSTSQRRSGERQVRSAAIQRRYERKPHPRAASRIPTRWNLATKYR
jgi:hypothetical protein